MPTKRHLNYLKSKVSISILKDAFTKFNRFLNDLNVDFFFGEFGEKYDNKTYYGWYAYDSKTRNMMFFRESGIDSEGDKGYVLHAYMNVRLGRVADFLKNKSLFD